MDDMKIEEGIRIHSIPDGNACLKVNYQLVIDGKIVAFITNDDAKDIIFNALRVWMRIGKILEKLQEVF